MMTGVEKASMASLTAVSPSDVAVGAPKEEDFAGAVYIYHGDANGIVPKYSMVSVGGTVMTLYVWCVFVCGVCVHMCVQVSVCGIRVCV